MKEKFTFKDGIAAIVILATFAYFFMCTFLKLRDEQIVTALIAADAMILGYYFGSSISSSKKDETMATLANNQPTVINSDIADNKL